MQVLKSLRQSTLKQWPNAARMQWLVSTMNARKALEIGVFTGYSAVCIAKGLPDDGMLIGFDRDERPLELAKQAFRQAAVDHKVQLEVGLASAGLQASAVAAHVPFDFAFVDADKRGYPEYHEQLLPIIRPGGVIVYDNMLWYGAVADSLDQKKATIALREFSNQLMRDSRIAYSLIPVGDGMALCRKL